jgi:mannosyltransferase
MIHWPRAQWSWVAGVLITLLALGLRFYRLDGQSLWTDEVASIETARAPLPQLVEQSAARNNSLPTYFLLLRPLVGQSNEHIEFRSRWPSALAGGLSVPVFMLLVYRWRGNWTVALVAGLLLAVNPLHLWYSQEVRAYALMLFFGLLSLLGFEWALAGRRLFGWATYSLAGIAAVALHKTAFLFPLVCLIIHGREICRNRQKLSSIWSHVFVVAAIIAAFSLKSYPPPQSFGRASSPLELVYTAMTFVGGYSFGPSLTEIQSFGAVRAVMRHLPETGLLGAELLLLAVLIGIHWRKIVLSREGLLLGLTLAAVALGSIISAFPYNVRYALPALFGFLGMTAALARLERRCLRLAVCGLVAIGLCADAQWFRRPIYRKGDSRAVAQWLVQHPHVRSWTVLPDYLSDSVEFYLAGHAEVLDKMQRAQAPQSTTFPPVPDALIIGRRHHIAQPDEIIAAYAASAGEIETNRVVAGFEIYVRK